MSESTGGALPRAPDALREAAEETFRTAMVMFEELPEGSWEDAPYSSLALAIVALRKALDATPSPEKQSAAPHE